MFAGLARNIAITGVAYFIISAIGLLLAPFLIAAYGLAGYGQILLARIFLPSATFGAFDMGVGENTTRIVASSRANGDAEKAGRSLTLLFALALGMGIILGTVLALLAPSIAGWLSISLDQRDGFIAILRITAALEPFLFVALLAEGVLKGCEEFKRLRTCEVVSAVLYASLAVAAILGGLGPNMVAGALLAGLCIRALLAVWWSRPLLEALGITAMRWTRDVRRDVLAWTSTMFQNKLLGTAQTQLGAPLLGVLVGPGAVGLYDAIVRIPRFVKSIFSLLSTTVLPLASRLRAGGEQDDLRRLARVGILASFVMCAPLAAMAAVYAEPILRLWIGADIARYWPWLAIMFVVPLANMPRSFGGSVVLADHQAVRILNRLFLLQIVLQIAIAVYLLPRFNPWSFVIAEVTTVSGMLVFQMAVIGRRLHLDAALWWRLLAILSTAAVIALAVRFSMPMEPGILMLGVALVVGVCASYAVSPFVAVDRATRKILARLAKDSLLERRRR